MSTLNDSSTIFISLFIKSANMRVLSQHASHEGLILKSNAGLTRFRRVSWQVWIFAYTASQGPEITPSAGPECPSYPCHKPFLFLALTLTLSVMLTLTLTVFLTLTLN